MVVPLVKALRPHQWVKNLFLAAPLIFARRVEDLTADLRVAAAIAVFCALSSAVYVLNDIMDVDKDRAHPHKRHRPIASGTIPVPTARTLALGLLLLGLAGAVLLGWRFLAAAGAYLVLNRAYTVSLKRIAFIDVGCIALGFLIRVVAGAVAVSVEPSLWLLVCTLFLASLLGFGKRAHELRVAGDAGQREALGGYRLDVLERLMTALALATTVVYALYTQSEHAQSMFATRKLLATVPFVAFGIFRFVRIVNSKTEAESPTDSMLRDVPFMANLGLYAAAVMVIIYFR